MKINFVSKDGQEVVYEGSMGEVAAMLPQVKAENPGVEFSHAYPADDMSEESTAVYF